MTRQELEDVIGARVQHAVRTRHWLDAIVAHQCCVQTMLAVGHRHVGALSPRDFLVWPAPGVGGKVEVEVEESATDPGEEIPATRIARIQRIAAVWVHSCQSN